MNDCSLRARIHTLTKPVHDLLDSDPMSLRIMASDVTRSEYVAFLARTYGFMKPIEDQLLSPAVSALLDPVLGHRAPQSPAILVDLHALGTDGSTEPPTMRKFPVIETIGHAMGVSYLIQGSSMGGLVMAKSLSRHLGLTPANGLSFFLPAEPRKVVKRFQEFAARLDVFAECECDAQDAIDAADQTFRLIAAWFAEAPAV